METGRGSQRSSVWIGLLGALCGLLASSGAVSTVVAQHQQVTRTLERAKHVAQGATTGLFTVIALRVEFQPDTTQYSSGDGTFAGDPFGGLVPAVDPLPHDAAYFEAHLLSLAHYMGAASDGQVEIRSIVLPDVIRVSRKMAEYTPIGPDATSDEQLVRLGRLVGEAWSTADDQMSVVFPPDIDPARTFFVLFHAGIGRDIELVGTTLDKTPLDLPSIFFDSRSLGRLGVGGLSLNGLPVANTAIIPRTETRRGFDFISDEPFLVELSTNGLLAASFLNYLGVPDLFDTKTGESAIGPFGLMDPLGIFAYNGLLPPEPSAWTKLFLGWTAATEIRATFPADLTLRAASGAASDAARVWVSDSEYFLVENRYRDVNDDGLVLQVWNSGVVSEHRFTNADPDFNDRSIAGFPGGVVVGADDYDWSLPGGVDEADNPLLGGALIWHVDERRIAEGLPQNTVNADRSRRAVDLEEADSGQDLGFPVEGIFGPALDQGSPFDFFYLGNPVRVITSTGNEVRLYENRFAGDTYPSSRSNEGGLSFIEIADFSVPGPVMTAVVRRELGARVQPVDSAAFTLGSAVGASFAADPLTGLKPCGTDEPFFAAFAVDSLSSRRSLVMGDRQGVLAVVDSVDFAASQFACIGDEVWAIADVGGSLDVKRIDPRRNQVLDVATGVSSADFDATSPVIATDSRVIVVFRSETAGRIVSMDRSGAQVSQFSVDFDPVATSYAGDGRIALGSGGFVAIFDAEGTMREQWDIAGSGFRRILGLTFGTDADGRIGFAVSESGDLAVLHEGGEFRVVPSSADGMATPPVVHDLDSDGRLDVMFARAGEITTYTRGGAVVSGFPLAVSAPIQAQPLVLNTTDGGSPVVFAPSTNGYLYAFDLVRGGREIEGFPLAIGRSIVTTPAVQDGRLYTLSAGGSVRVWGLEGFEPAGWSQVLGDSGNRSYVSLSEGEVTLPQTASLLVAEETYNWPNPITDGVTHFRLETTEDASVAITIVDMAGADVDRLDVALVRAGVPTEVTWSTGAQSGLYFARITATTAADRSESRLVRLAVIR